MKIIIFKKGFTLLELLIVVLIIGVLTGIALPKYQESVDKAKMVQYKTIINSIIKSQNIYYLANGEYTKNLKNLDIDITKFRCSLVGVSDLLECQGATISNSVQSIVMRYCPSLKNPDYNTCIENRILNVVYRYQNAQGPSGQRNGSWVCAGYTDRGRKLIKEFCP